MERASVQHAHLADRFALEVVRIFMILLALAAANGQAVSRPKPRQMCSHGPTRYVSTALFRETTLLLLQVTFGILGASMIAVLVLSYLWSSFGRRVRRVTGPWLINFEPSQWSFVALRDMLTLFAYTCLFGLAFLGSENEVLFSIVSCLMMAALFGGAYLSDHIDQEHKETNAVTLLLSEHLSPKDMVAFLRQNGALIGGSRQSFLARFHGKYGFIWMYPVTDTIPHITSDIVAQHSDPPRAALFFEAQKRLNADIQTSCAITTSRTVSLEKQQRGLAEVICLFQQKWPCIIIDAKRQVFSGIDICNNLETTVPLLALERPGKSRLWMLKRLGG